MRVFAKGLAASLLCCATLTGPASARLQTGSNRATDDFQVSINVEGSCLVPVATDITFGSVTAGAGQRTQVGEIRFQCSKDLPFTVGLDGGTTSNNVNARAMRHGASEASIPYTLRHDSAGGTLWTDEGAGLYSGNGLGLGAGNEIVLRVHAEATLSGNEPAGAYSDTVMVTLTY